MTVSVTITTSFLFPFQLQFHRPFIVIMVGIALLLLGQHTAAVGTWDIQDVIAINKHSMQGIIVEYTVKINGWDELV